MGGERAKAILSYIGSLNSLCCMDCLFSEQCKQKSKEEKKFSGDLEAKTGNPSPVS